MSEWERRATSYEQLLAAAVEVRRVAGKTDRSPDDISTIDDLDRAVALAWLYVPHETLSTMTELGKRARRVVQVRAQNALHAKVVKEAQEEFTEAFGSLIGELRADLRKDVQVDLGHDR